MGFDNISQIFVLIYMKNPMVDRHTFSFVENKEKVLKLFSKPHFVLSSEI